MTERIYRRISVQGTGRLAKDEFLPPNFDPFLSFSPAAENFVYQMRTMLRCPPRGPLAGVGVIVASVSKYNGRARNRMGDLEGP